MRKPRGPGRIRSSLRRQAIRAARAAYLRVEASPLAHLLRLPVVQRLKAQITYTPASRVLAVLDLVAAEAVQAWLAGGWGIDALAGRQTRRHYDLDLVISDAPGDYQKVADALGRAGFRIAQEQLNASLAVPMRYLWQNDEGHSVEIMPVALHRPPFSTVPRSGQDEAAGSPFAIGHIGGRLVPCLSARLQAALHAGYPLRHIDVCDLNVLHAHVNRREGTLT